MGQYEWMRVFHDGIYQFVGYCGETDEKGIETKLDVADGKCKELWDRIKEEFPEANGYRSFCEAYRIGLAEWNDFWRRENARYNSYWEE